MATSYVFGNQKISKPGVYSQIKSGIKNPTIDLGFGSLLVIDTGSGATFGGGAGINGTLASGKDAVYTMDNSSALRDFTSGGLWWFLADPLFTPASLGTSGISSITFVKAATTTPAEITYTWTGGGANGGTITFQVRSEGIIGNGVENTSNVLAKGHAAVMVAGTRDTSKFKLKFYRGLFRGSDSAISDGEPFNRIAQEDLAEAELIAESVEFDNISDLGTWAADDFNFNQHYKLKVVTPAGDGSVDAADLAASAGNELATGGTETYGTTDLDDALDALVDGNFDFILADDWGANAESTSNLSILSWIVNEANIKPDMYVGGGKDSAKFKGSADSSIEVAQSYDSQYVTVVHGGVKKSVPRKDGFKEYDSIVTAAYCLGREAGLAPQVPLTFKGINVDGVLHPLNSAQIEDTLDFGVIAIEEASGSFDIVKGINTLQENDFLVNEDGTTSSKQIRRIARQINKEILFNARRDLLKQDAGVNRNTLSELDVELWLKGYLSNRTVTSTTDNLILGFQNITVERRADAYFISYEIIPNGEISFLFFTGFLIDA